MAIFNFSLPGSALTALAGDATSHASYLLAAFAVQYVGSILARWFFFAQANHPQNLCYQTV
jgi:DMSO reductase anchor subunit